MGRHRHYVTLLASISAFPILSEIKKRIELSIIRRNCEHLFDEDFYRSQVLEKDVNKSDALKHFVQLGAQEGHNPHRLFDLEYYEEIAPDMPRGINPLVHFHLVGKRQGKSPTRWFDRQYYLDRNHDVRIAKVDPYLHFVRYGVFEDRTASALFDPHFYRSRNDDARLSEMPSLYHFLDVGRATGRLARSMAETSGDFEDSGKSQRLFRGTDKTSPEIERAELLQNLLSFKRSKESASPEVDIIIPVYRNFNITLRCLLSVLQSENETVANVVVIDDKTPDEQLADILKKLSDHGLIELLQHEENEGFVKSVNDGMKLHSNRDVVLLNSDTEVFSDWLDRLKSTAYGSRNIGTVTPLTNKGTICSYPYFGKDNGVPVDIDIQGIDVLARKVNRGAWVSAPTCVGFCTYIKRDVINEIGLFDAETFGMGYGEENDFSLRAQRAGWIDAIATDVVIYHAGNTSFLGEKTKRLIQANKIIQKLYPNYHKEVAAYISRDPVLPYRQAIDRARLRRLMTSKNILIVSHSRGGGTEQSVLENIEKHTKKGTSVFRLVPGEQPYNTAKLVHHSSMALPNLPEFNLRSPAGRTELTLWIKDIGIAEMEIHHLADFWTTMPHTFSKLAEEANIPYRFVVHDYLSICPRINLIDERSVYCGEPSAEVCNACLKNRGSEFGASDIVQWRRNHHLFLGSAQQVVVPNEDVESRLSRHFPDIKFSVEPHEIASQAAYVPRKREPGGKIRVGIPGAISPIKGLEVLKRCAKYSAKERLNIEFVVVGYTSDDTQSRKAGLEITGPYSSDNLVEELHNARLDAVFLPSTWPETFSYTLSGALRTGLPIVSFDIGAIANRLNEASRARRLPLEFCDSPQMIVDEILDFVREMEASASSSA